ncbi:MAG: Asp-tRNA(Asn)/Glu-tRNA(Gln) amidotransferase subunit GatC [Gemmatimonadota bacterium]
MRISRSELERIAELASLELSEEEAERLTRDCQAILEYFEIVRGADTGDAAPAGPLEHAGPPREDSADCDPLRRRLDEIAPAWREGYFVLPRLPAMDADIPAESDDV